MKRNYSEFEDLEVVTGLSKVDHRGSLEKFDLQNDFDFDSMLISENIAAGTFRGLHIQIPPYGEVKLVKCLKGKICDVVLDLRAGSRTLGDWCKIHLSENDGKAILIPVGFAHGFQTLEENTKVLYLISGKYREDSSYSIDYLDPNLGLTLPLTITEISQRDANGISISRYLEM